VVFNLSILKFRYPRTVLVNSLLDGTFTHLPAWMASAEICQTLKVIGTPMVSLNSLVALWNILHPGQENPNFSRSSSKRATVEGEGCEEQRDRVPTSVSIQERWDLGSVATQGTGESSGIVHPDGDGAFPAGLKGGENG